MDRGEYWFPRVGLASIVDLWKASQQNGAGTAAAIAHPADQDSAALTPREEEVFTCLKQGMSNKEIARFLAVSPETIKVYVKRVTAKLQLRNRYQAMDLLVA
ncbi:MAG: hypothetical protein FJ189_12935 [Gammaproteobacteria bacterium]|nr:hypothetical protein [Gammaproteobacteria bacterium]